MAQKKHTARRIRRRNLSTLARAIRISKYGYNRRLAHKNKDILLKYIIKDGRIPKLDKFMDLNQGALVKTLDDIDTARTRKPGKRGPYKNYRYLQEILTTVPKQTTMMFLERHPKFPEYYHFCIIGGSTVWIDISDYLPSLSIMRPPRKSKKQTQKIKEEITE